MQGLFSSPGLMLPATPWRVNPVVSIPQFTHVRTEEWAASWDPSELRNICIYPLWRVAGPLCAVDAGDGQLRPQESTSQNWQALWRPDFTVLPSPVPTSTLQGACPPCPLPGRALKPKQVGCLAGDHRAHQEWSQGPPHHTDCSAGEGRRMESERHHCQVKEERCQSKTVGCMACCGPQLSGTPPGGTIHTECLVYGTWDSCPRWKPQPFPQSDSSLITGMWLHLNLRWRWVVGGRN